MNRSEILVVVIKVNELRVDKINEFFYNSQAHVS